MLFKSFSPKQDNFRDRVSLFRKSSILLSFILIGRYFYCSSRLKQGLISGIYQNFSLFRATSGKIESMFKVVGDFHLKHRIGKGNYADVYLGEHKTTGKPYAIKVIAKERFSHPKLISGLESEVKIMREFTHRNIVQLERYFSSQNNFYLVLDYCAGGDLSKFIKKSQRLRENTAFNFLSQIADGISFLNERNFIHRDLKSANVLLTETSPNATLKIADFGFARQLQGDALAGTACGTPLYMAPEILEAREYDAKADIWSIGCIFYEMLAGHCPFSGVNETDLLNNIRTKELRVPSDVSKVSVGILVKVSPFSFCF